METGFDEYAKTDGVAVATARFSDAVAGQLISYLVFVVLGGLALVATTAKIQNPKYRIIHKLANDYQPQWFLVENVGGLKSANDG